MSLSNEQMMVRAVLLRGFILVRKSWCKGAAGRTQKGGVIPMIDIQTGRREPHTVCAVGAVYRAGYEMAPHQRGEDMRQRSREARLALDHALAGWKPTDSSESFNDWDVTTLDDVLALYKRAIRLLEAR